MADDERRAEIEALESQVEWLEVINARLRSELQALVEWSNVAPFLRAERLLYDLERGEQDQPQRIGDTP